MNFLQSSPDRISISEDEEVITLHDTSSDDSGGEESATSVLIGQSSTETEVRLPKLTRIPQWSEAVQTVVQKRIYAQLYRDAKKQIKELNAKCAELNEKNKKQNEKLEAEMKKLETEMEKQRQELANRDETISLYKRLLSLEKPSKLAIETKSVAIQTHEDVFGDYLKLQFPPMSNLLFSKYRNDQDNADQSDWMIETLNFCELLWVMSILTTTSTD